MSDFTSAKGSANCSKVPAALFLISSPGFSVSFFVEASGPSGVALIRPRAGGRK